ncbi:Flagellar radial spoke protein 5 [Linum grandiflorum]
MVEMLLHRPLSNFGPRSSIKLVRRKVGEARSYGIRLPLQCVLSKDERRITVKNGKDSLDICRVVNGMWQTSSGGWGKIELDSAVDAMIKHVDGGLNTFDMADICNVRGAFRPAVSCQYGPAEDLYGMFVNRVRRERPPEVLEQIRGLTKWVPPPVKMTSNYVRENINLSRKRMDVPCLDMLQFHWWDYSNSGYIDALKHLTDLKEEGKIKTVALTNFDTERLQIILENGIPVVSNQVQHSIVDMRPQQKMAELCQLTGVKLITYGTVMGGLLSEKFLDTNLSIPFAGPPLNTPSLQKYKRMVDAWGGWGQFQVLLKTLKKVATKHGVSIPTVAVKYILDQPAVAGSMVGVRLGLSEHVNDSNAVFTLELDEEDVESIREKSPLLPIDGGSIPHAAFVSCDSELMQAPGDKSLARVRVSTTLNVQPRAREEHWPRGFAGRNRTEASEGCSILSRSRFCIEVRSSLQQQSWTFNVPFKCEIVDAQPTMEETILVGEDLMLGPASPVIPKEIASHVLEGVDLCDGILKNLFLCLQVNDIEPFCQDELSLYRECAEKRDKQLRQRLQDSEHKLGLSMPLDQAKDRVAQLEAEATAYERRLILASGVEGIEGFRQRWSLHGRMSDTKRRLEALKQGMEGRNQELKKDQPPPPPPPPSKRKKWGLW